jgi:hypothetical protein
MPVQAAPLTACNACSPPLLCPLLDNGVCIHIDRDAPREITDLAFLDDPAQSV